MAEKKTTKTEVKKMAAKVAKTTKDLRELSFKELTDLVVIAQKDLSDARRSLAAGELVNPRVINNYRKEIARLKTILVEKARQTTGKEDA